MLPVDKPIRELKLEGKLPDELLRATEPYVVRGLAAHWPLVDAARSSIEAADAYLRRFYRDATVGAMLGKPDIVGRFFYNEDLTGFNYYSVRARLDAVLDEMKGYRNHPQPAAIYVGSTSIDTALPGLRAFNDIDLGPRDALASIWIGNQTRIAAHYDLPDNLAVVAAGRRRFTLFPPEQLANLYIGPPDFNPAGQAISLVDFAAPDYERFPRFREALRHACVAELEPGDAIFIPSMWWHHVEALAAFNVLVNYWWRDAPLWFESPLNTLLHALLSLKGLPPGERARWRALFDHLIFQADGEPLAHLPDAARGLFGKLTPEAAAQIRAILQKSLSR